MLRNKSWRGTLEDSSRQSLGLLWARVFAQIGLHAECCEGLVLPVDNQATREKSRSMMTGHS